MSDSLFDRLGGAPAVEAAVELFYQKILADPQISHFFEGTNMAIQQAKQKAFLTMVFGGPARYSGQDLRRAHAPLVERGLTDSHFDAVAGHLQATLEELGVAPDLTDEVMSIAASTRDDVLSR
ncbi:MAG: group 1 truncated hemoglobin [Kiloniellales bacterium]|nr:group 1 truncated hemoglobin [Kiloniellales bacterium]